jgi:hypothetical protein
VKETYHLEHLWPVIDDMEYIRRGKEPLIGILNASHTSSTWHRPQHLVAKAIQSYKHLHTWRQGTLSINPCVSFVTRLVYYAWFLYYLPVVRNTNKNLPLYICNFRVALVSSLLMWKKGVAYILGAIFRCGCKDSCIWKSIFWGVLSCHLDRCVFRGG